MPTTTEPPVTPSQDAKAQDHATGAEQPGEPKQTSATSIERGRPSYSWRYGQDRRLEMVRYFVNIVLAVGEDLPFPDDHFDLVFSNEVIEHVADDRATAAEMVRVTKPGGTIVAFAPNRPYPFETHGAYFGGATSSATSRS